MIKISLIINFKKEKFNQDKIYKEDNKDIKYEYHPNTCLNIGFQPK